MHTQHELCIDLQDGAMDHVSLNVTFIKCEAFHDIYVPFLYFQWGFSGALNYPSNIVALPEKTLTIEAGPSLSDHIGSEQLAV